MLFGWLRHHGLPYVTVATKTDKISRNKMASQREMIRKGLALAKDDPILTFSALTGEGKEQIWKAIARAFGSEQGA
jgi:GTP-binding protein